MVHHDGSTQPALTDIAIKPPLAHNALYALKIFIYIIIRVKFGNTGGMCQLAVWFAEMPTMPPRHRLSAFS